MQLVAAGREADVFAYDDGLVLRRNRGGRPADRDAALMRSLHALGFPVPRVDRAGGPDIVMERVEGPTMLAAMMTGLTVAEAARILARLHDELHALAWPDEKTLLHMDLHPLNVLMSPAGPVVIDWTNARRGPAGLDVAMAALILAQVAVGPALLADLPPHLRDGPRDLLASFAAAVGTPYAEHLAEAAQLRRLDAGQTAADLAHIDEAVALAHTLHP